MSTPSTHRIDVREIAPAQRHSLIFSDFEALLPGQTLELINDHDPQPLNAQFELRVPGAFSWSYLEKGPQIWRVQIGKSAKAANAAADSCCSGGSCCG